MYKIGGQFDVVVNIQGDEPFIQPSQLQAVKACFDDSATQIATLVKPFTVDNGFEALENVNSPKVVLNKTGMPSIQPFHHSLPAQCGEGGVAGEPYIL